MQEHRDLYYQTQSNIERAQIVPSSRDNRKLFAIDEGARLEVEICQNDFER